MQGPALPNGPPPPPPPSKDDSLSDTQMAELAKKAGVRVSKLEKMDKLELMRLWREFEKTRLKVPAVSLKIVKDDTSESKVQTKTASSAASAASSKSAAPPKKKEEEAKAAGSGDEICTWLLQSEGSDPVWRRLTDISNKEVNEAYKAVVLDGEGGWFQKAKVNNPTPRGLPHGLNYNYQQNPNNPNANKKTSIFDSDTPPEVHLTLKLGNGSKIAVTFLKKKDEQGNDAMAMSDVGSACAMRRVVQKASTDPLSREWSLLSMRFQPVYGGLRPKGVLEVIRKVSGICACMTIT